MKGEEFKKFKEEYDFSLDDLARLLGMHKEHVRKLFKREKEYKLLELACKSIIKNDITKQGFPATGRGIVSFRKRNNLSRKEPRATVTACLFGDGARYLAAAIGAERARRLQSTLKSITTASGAA
jgi:DNA-binding transcriptional regulator YiaG